MSNTQSQSENSKVEVLESQLSTSKTIHPEDLRVDDDVAISKVMFQYPSYPWTSCAETLPAREPVGVTFLSQPDTEPMQIKAICLPFVLCKVNENQHRVFDLRQFELVRLDKTFATQFRIAREADNSASYGFKSKNKKNEKKKSRKKKKAKKRKAK